MSNIFCLWGWLSSCCCHYNNVSFEPVISQLESCRLFFGGVERGCRLVSRWRYGASSAPVILRHKNLWKWNIVIPIPKNIRVSVFRWVGLIVIDEWNWFNYLWRHKHGLTSGSTAQPIAIARVDMVAILDVAQPGFYSMFFFFLHVQLSEVTYTYFKGRTWSPDHTGKNRCGGLNHRVPQQNYRQATVALRKALTEKFHKKLHQLPLFIKSVIYCITIFEGI